MKHINFLLDDKTVEIIDKDAKKNQRSRTSQIVFIIKQFYSTLPKSNKNKNKNEV
jgi:hypothetical protein